MPEFPRSSLVGRAPELGRGDAGGLRLIGAGRLPDGPIEALEALFGPFGAGEGLGLVDGGRRDIIRNQNAEDEGVSVLKSKERCW